MASGRTVSGSILTEFDKKVLEFCEVASNVISDLIPIEIRADFVSTFGKVNFSRDAGSGVGGGKLQRDALCTRGRGGKAPFSNRNLRWHPLLAAAEKPPFAKAIDRIDISYNDELIFTITDDYGNSNSFPSDLVHNMPGRYVATTEHWAPHVDVLRNWNDTQWSQNSCIIPALEACNWWDSIQTYVFLGISTAVEFFKADFDKLLLNCIKLLEYQQIDSSIKLPTDDFPINKEDFVLCPVTKIHLSGSLSIFRKVPRPLTWQPNWMRSKKSEGDDDSIQIMHINPLIESEIRHTVSNVRYGFRWSNVAMTDHSLDETLDFMSHIVKVHGRDK